jgi:NADP-dependent 3-hydroxy acid dehydrogenase YdfG
MPGGTWQHIVHGVSPGVLKVSSNMQNEEIRNQLQERQEEIGLDPRAIARQIVYALAQPQHLMLHEIAIMSIEED